MVKEIKIKDIKELFLKRDKDANKGDFGKVGLLGGSVNYSGAIKLASMSLSALRSGCGLVRVIVPSEIVNSVSPYLIEQTLYPYNNLEDIQNAKNYLMICLYNSLGNTNISITKKKENTSAYKGRTYEDGSLDFLYANFAYDN